MELEGGEHSSAAGDEIVSDYLAFGALASYIVKLLENNRKEKIQTAFEVVENRLLHGDTYVREATIVGVLEDLQNANLHRHTKASDFAVFLGPEASYWWVKLERFWSHGELLIDDRG